MSIDNSFTFELEAGKPSHTGTFDCADETIGEMVQTIFPLETNCVVVHWAGVPFTLNYKYDLGMMLEDILILLRELISKPSGKMTIAHVSSGYPYRWDVEWATPDLEIHAFPHGHSISTQRGHELIRKSIHGFVAEWMPVLENVRSAAFHSGYDISSLRSGEILQSLVGK